MILDSVSFFFILTSNSPNGCTGIAKTSTGEEYDIKIIQKFLPLVLGCDPQVWSLLSTEKRKQLLNHVEKRNIWARVKKFPDQPYLILEIPRE